jgi:hypothetical protein
MIRILSRTVVLMLLVISITQTTQSRPNLNALQAWSASKSAGALTIMSSESCTGCMQAQPCNSTLHYCNSTCQAANPNQVQLRKCYQNCSNNYNSCETGARNACRNFCTP